jgi:hypothetical protein
MFTGNRGCLVNDNGELARHHNGSLWISCVLEWGGRRVPLAAPRTWTPLFFLDDAVALAAGHRPCGYCRRSAHLAYRDAVSAARSERVTATELNRLLAEERYTANMRGAMERSTGRRTWLAESAVLPTGTVTVGDDNTPQLIADGVLWRFRFSGWERPEPLRPGPALVLTPPTSVAALANGFVPVLHSSATR